MLTTFVIVSVISFFILFLMWSASDFVNMFIKAFWAGMVVWSLVILWPTLTATSPQPGQIELPVNNVQK